MHVGLQKQRKGVPATSSSSALGFRKREKGSPARSRVGQAGSQAGPARTTSARCRDDAAYPPGGPQVCDVLRSPRDSSRTPWTGKAMTTGVGCTGHPHCKRQGATPRRSSCALPRGSAEAWCWLLLAPPPGVGPCRAGAVGEGDAGRGHPLQQVAAVAAAAPRAGMSSAGARTAAVTRAQPHTKVNKISQNHSAQCRGDRVMGQVHAKQTNGQDGEGCTSG